MLNTHTLARFEVLQDQLLQPIYADYSFGNLAATIEHLLAGAEPSGPVLPADCFGGIYPSPRQIVLFFIDSFGWRLWQQIADQVAPCRRLAEQGIVTPISALFPSTTAASVTTANLGVLPARHALYEWNLYIPAYGAVIQTLPFAPLGSRQLDQCLAMGYEPSHLLAYRETLYTRLARRGIPSTQYLSHLYAGSAYNQVASAGATIVPFETLAGGLDALRVQLDSLREPAFLCLYWDQIDAAGHAFGPGSTEQVAAAARFWATFEASFSHFRNRPGLLFLFVADHGQIGSDPAATLALNREIPGLTELLARTPAGEPIRPNGSGRDVFLHLRPECRDEAAGLLRERLADRALVLTTEEALARGLFGPPPFGDEFRRRLGDLLILPAADEYIWWHEPGVLENRSTGHHGGLTADELITVVTACETL